MPALAPPAIAAFLLVALPWLNPFSPGPTSSVAPLLFAWFCAAVLLGLCALAPQRLTGDRLVRAIALAWLVAALASAVMGLLQYLGATAALGGWVSRADVGVAFANLRQRNQFATLIQMGLLALLWWAGSGSARLAGPPGETTAAPRWQVALGSLPALLMMAVLLGAANAASSSRTGLLQLVLVAALVGWWGRWREPRVGLVMLAAGAAYVLALFALPWLAGLDPSSGAWARLRAGDAVCGSRLTLWGNVLHVISQKPWLGWGWGELDYAHFITLYPGARFCDILDNAHNLPLQLAVVLGVPATVLLCGAGLWLVWRARPWREVDATRQLAWGVLAVIGLHSLLEYPLWYGPFQVACVLCVWLLWRAALGEKFKRFRPLALAAKASLAIIMIGSVGLVAWDYHRVRQIFLPPAQRAAAYQTDALAKAQGAWWFARQAQFAELTTTPLTPGNAVRLHALTKDLLHFSPEPRVIETLIDSAALLGRDDEVAFYTARYQAAFPERYARWVSGRVKGAGQDLVPMKGV
jgi:O-antigen ligase